MKLEDEKIGIKDNKVKNYKCSEKSYIMKNYIEKTYIQDIIYLLFISILCSCLYLNILKNSKIKNNYYIFNKSIFNIIKEGDNDTNLLPKENKITNFNNEVLNNLLPKENKITNFNNEVLKKKFKNEINFLQKCSNDTKIKSFDKLDNPKLSIIIPIHNKEKYINRLMQSIQQQNLKEIEIIFIDDYSEDKGIKLLKKYRKLDKRIIIIKNEKYEGTVMSFSKGINKARANYSLLFNPEDMLLPDILFLYYILSNVNKDICEFSYLYGKINVEKEVKIERRELYQPNLQKIIFLNYHQEIVLHNKIMKTKMLQKAVESLKNDYLKSLEYHWEKILFISILSKAETYRSLPSIYINFHTNNENEISKNIYKDYNNLFKSSVYLLQYISEFKYPYKKIFNMYIKYANDILQLQLDNCGNNILEENWKQLNKTMYRILNKWELNKENKMVINDLLKDIKTKINNNNS